VSEQPAPGNAAGEMTVRLELPVQQPGVLIPVVELFLK